MLVNGVVWGGGKKNVGRNSQEFSQQTFISESWIRYKLDLNIIIESLTKNLISLQFQIPWRRGATMDPGWI